MNQVFKLFIASLFLCSTASFAQGIQSDNTEVQKLIGNTEAMALNQAKAYEIVTSFESVVDVINESEEEILLRVNTLRNLDLAEALRIALVERGVTVYMLIPTTGLEDNGSYFLALASIGAKVRIADGTGAFLVSDREVTVFGDLLEHKTINAGDMLTMKTNSPVYAEQVTNGFISAFSKLPQWDWQSIIEANQ